MFGAWSLYSIWHLVLSSFSIATLIGIAAAAVAVLMPPIIAAVIPNLRIIAIYVAIGAFSFSTVAGKFYHDGLVVKQAEWDAAKVKEAENGESAREDAERSVSSDPDGMRNDPRNRDTWK